MPPTCGIVFFTCRSLPLLLPRAEPPPPPRVLLPKIELPATDPPQYEEPPPRSDDPAPLPPPSADPTDARSVSPPPQGPAVLSRSARGVEVAGLEGGQVGEGGGAGVRAGGLAAAGGDDVGAVWGDKVDYALLGLRRRVSGEVDGALHST